MDEIGYLTALYIAFTDIMTGPFMIAMALILLSIVTVSPIYAWIGIVILVGIMIGVWLVE